MVLHRESFREEVKSLEETDWPVSAICIKALAPRRSTIVYNRFVANGCNEEFGSKENIGRSNGA